MPHCVRVEARAPQLLTATVCDLSHASRGSQYPIAMSVQIRHFAVFVETAGMLAGRSRKAGRFPPMMFPPERRCRAILAFQFRCRSVQERGAYLEMGENLDKEQSQARRAPQQH